MHNNVITGEELIVKECVAIQTIFVLQNILVAFNIALGRNAHCNPPISLPLLCVHQPISFTSGVQLVVEMSPACSTGICTTYIITFVYIPAHNAVHVTCMLYTTYKHTTYMVGPFDMPVYRT